MKTWTVYALVDPRDERVRYVGWTVDLNKRLVNHCRQSAGGGSHKAHWIRQLLAEGVRPLVEILESGSGDWAQAERRWISLFRALGAPLTNATDGGDGAPGFRPSAETRRKMSAAHTGRKQSPESIAKTRAFLLGRKQGAAHLAALSAVRKGREPVKATAAAAAFWRGRKQSVEHVAKRIAPHRGRVRPELHRLTPEQVREIRAARGVLSLRTLAAKYGVGQTTVFEVQHRTAYAHVD